jgi:hypothetical protein
VLYVFSNVESKKFKSHERKKEGDEQEGERGKVWVMAKINMIKVP